MKILLFNVWLINCTIMVDEHLHKDAYEAKGLN